MPSVWYSPRHWCWVWVAGHVELLSTDKHAIEDQLRGMVLGMCTSDMWLTLRSPCERALERAIHALDTSEAKGEQGPLLSGASVLRAVSAYRHAIDELQAALRPPLIEQASSEMRQSMEKTIKSLHVLVDKLTDDGAVAAARDKRRQLRHEAQRRAPRFIGLV